MVSIVSTATLLPPFYYPQDVLASVLRKYCLMNELDFDLEVIDRFFTNVKINGRYFMLPLDSFYEPPSLEQSMQAAVKATVDLMEETLWRLLKPVNLDPTDIHLLSAISLLPATPALDTHLMNRMGFAPTLKRLPLGGVGCMGGAFGLARVADYLEGHPTEAAILVAAEPSSSLWQGSLQRDLKALIQQLPQDQSQYSNIIMAIVTAALFGDGAAAVLMVGDEHPLAASGQPRIIDSQSYLLPRTIHLMGMEIINTGTRNILRPEVSDVVKVGLQNAVGSLLRKHHLSIHQITRWVVHPGGPKILQAVEEEMGLERQLLRLSHEALAEVGNLSSPTVLYILDKTLADAPPEPGSYGLMIAMGPGFAQEAVLLQW